MSRWTLSISTTAGVVLFSFGAYAMIHEGRYALAGLFLFFAFFVPLQTEAIRDKVLKRDSKLGSEGKSVHERHDT